MIDIRIDEEDFARAVRQLKGVPYALQKVFIPTVSEVMGHIRDELVSYLESDVPLPDKALKKAVRLGQVAKAGDTVKGSVTVQSKAQPLIYYDVEPQEVTATPGKRPSQWPDFTFSLRTGERREGKSRIHGIGLPFVAVMQGGHMEVYFRAAFTSQNTGKRSIKQAYGPSIQYHVVTPRVRSIFEEEAESRLPVVLARHLRQTLVLEAAK